MTAPSLARKTFTVSRQSEFASTAELAKATGHPVERWPLVIVKELIDNAIDAAEGANIAPVVGVAIESDGSIVVADRGPGMPPELVASLVDYSKRTSSRAAYVSPTRGAQGNALQTLIAMPFALDGSSSETLIESHGIRHRIVFAVDRVRQTPLVDHKIEASPIRIGSRITVRWPDRACSIMEAARDRFLSLAGVFVWLNPHLSLSVDWVDETAVVCAEATDPNWSKWRPDMPTSPHWYNPERLFRLIAAEIAHAEDHGRPCPTVRDFVREFRGLSSTVKAKTICDSLGVSGETLAGFHSRGEAQTAGLLAGMKRLSRPVNPRDLGVIGKDHLLGRFVSAGATAETFEYRCATFEQDGLPFAIETAFGFSGEEEGSCIVEGFNFTPAVGASPFRLEGKLAEQMIGQDDPVIAFAHLVSPRLEFLDRGKAQVALPFAVAAKLRDLVGGVTARWRKQRKAEERHEKARARRLDALIGREPRTTIKEAAWAVMEEAWRKASDNERLPANARQIMYAARPAILERTGKQTLSDHYFIQGLLVDYVNETGVAWDVVFDERGHLVEPHTSRMIGLGTLNVRSYLDACHKPLIRDAAVAGAGVATYGPQGRYGALLFVEKEGFMPILQAARLAERFDVAVMSTKGMSVTAARMLVERLCCERGVKLFVLHDFDISGFSIKKTLVESNRRYRFEREPDFVDLGLRLADVDRLSLQSEPVAIEDKSKDALRRRLAVNGATGQEIAFLVDRGRRVELNAMTSREFVDLIEQGLVVHGVAKVAPDEPTLAQAYSAFKRDAKAKAALQAELDRLKDEAIATPKDLMERVKTHLTKHPVKTWDEAVRAIVEEDA
jgi:DNA topoisomerase 6 subunit A-like protein/histidine kinase/DNA gyrase B/HSP90-like ATPase